MMEIYDDDHRLDAAVSEGIITATQAAQIRALTPPRTAARALRGVEASTVAYGLGAITVLVAMGWFLADRWELLGAGGVLAVVTVYAALFTIVALRMRREGYALAEGTAAVLIVACVPLAVIALSELLPWLPQPPARTCGIRHYTLDFWFDFWTCRGLEVSVELTTLLAATLAWRLTRFSPFALVVGGLALRFVFHAAAVFGGHAGVTATAWLWMIGASLAVAVAYRLDRQSTAARAVALWVHLLAAFAAVVASGMLLSQFDAFRHLLLPTAFVAFAFSMRMRRGVWTLLGLGWFVAYLVWLAADVFRETPVFPIVLAALGVALIVATVWVQRNRERLIRRIGGLESGAQPSFPGGVAVLLLPAVVALWQLPSAVALDKALAAEQRASVTAQRQVKRRRDRAARAEAAARETPPPPRP